MNKAFPNFLWKNYPNTTTPLDENDLNKLNTAINEIDNRVISMDTQKANQQTVLNLIRDWTINTTTGLITVTYENGTKKTFDGKLGKIAMNFSYDRTTQKIVLDLRDGTHEYIDISEFITQNEFAPSSTVKFIVSNGVVSAIVPDGSITEDKLEVHYLEDARDAKYGAEQARDYAEDYAKESEAWAVGSKDDVPVASTDEHYNNNSKYYAQQAGEILEFIKATLQIAEFSVNDQGELEYTDNSAYLFTINDDGELEWEVKPI